MTTRALPHDSYITAVDEALIAAGIGCDDGWTSDGDEYDDQDYTTLSAIFIWKSGDSALDPDLYEYGAGVYWALTTGWEWAAQQPNGANDVPQSLPLPLWAEPADVVAAVRAVLAGLPWPDQPAREWRNPAVALAVAAWAAE
jgi:hypothetical protein